MLATVRFIAPKWVMASMYLLFLAAGCGGNIASVSGRVTVDGEPLRNASVTFTPIATGTQSAGPGSYGKTDADGRFTLKRIDTDRPGAVVGKHRVIIASETDVGAESDINVPTKEVIPARYRDGSETFEVPAGGTSQANFEIKTK